MNLRVAVGILFLVVGHSYLVRDRDKEFYVGLVYATLGAALLSCSIA